MYSIRICIQHSCDYFIFLDQSCNYNVLSWSGEHNLINFDLKKVIGVYVRVFYISINTSLISSNYQYYPHTYCLFSLWISVFLFDTCRTIRIILYRSDRVTMTFLKSVRQPCLLSSHHHAYNVITI